MTQQKKSEHLKQQADEWVPPTDEHVHMKKFMKEQLESTINHDGDVTYYEGELKRVEEEMNDMNASFIRREMVEAIEHDITYHKRMHDEEVKRCEEANAWVKQLEESIK